MTTSVDASNLNRGLGMLRQYSKRTPAQMVNSAAYMVAVFTLANMPVVSPGRMDTELQVKTVPILKTATMGPRKGMKIETGENAIVNQVARTKAMMIVVARLHPNSDYSRMTGNYWGLTAPSFKSGAMRIGQGVSSQAQFWDWVEEVAERMVKARHSSSAFLKSCWVPAIRTLEPFISPSLKAAVVKYRSQVRNARPGGAAVVADAGWAKPARAGSNLVSAEIANAAGVAGPNEVLNEKHNQALWAVTPPVLQKAVNDEAMNVMTRVATEELKRDAGRLKAAGLIVDI